MNKHTVFVAGKRFVLLSEESNEYVLKIAREVSASIGKISEVNPTMESRSCAILCALDYADDMYKEIERSKRLSDNAKKVMAQSDKHAKDIKELKAKIDVKNAEIAKLKAEIDRLKALLADKPKAEPQKTETVKAEASAPKTKTAPVQTPKKKEKKHSHDHTNPYKAQAEKKRTVDTTEPQKQEKTVDEKPEKGYTPTRQISLFENE